MSHGQRQKLVINADDAGWSPNVDEDILRCAKAGVISSVSIMVSGECAGDFAADAKALDLGIGLHFNITEGRPLSRNAQDLTGPDGFFSHRKEEVWQSACTGFLNGGSLRKEIEAQWQALLDMGVTPDHVDGHNHVHLYPCVLAALLDVLPSDRPLHIRVPHDKRCTDAARPSFVEPHLTAEEMRRMIEDAGHFATESFLGFEFSHDPSLTNIANLKERKEPSCEWMVHPGRRDGSEFKSSELRAEETAILIGEELPARIKNWGYDIVRFGDLS